MVWASVVGGSSQQRVVELTHMRLQYPDANLHVLFEIVQVFWLVAKGLGGAGHDLHDANLARLTGGWFENKFVILVFLKAAMLEATLTKR